MKKALKLLLTILSSVIIAMVTLPIVAGLLLQVGVVQNYVVGRLTEWMTQKAGVTMSVRRVEIGFFNRAVLEGVFVENPIHRGDTMLYVDRLSAGIDGINFFTGAVSLGVVSLEDGAVNLAKDSAGVMNVKRVTDRFKPEKPREWGDFKLTARGLDLRGVDFSYRLFAPRVREHGVNFQDLDLRGISLRVRNITVFNDDVTCGIEHLSFREKSGFVLDRLAAERTVVNGTGLRFAGLEIDSPGSEVRMEHLDFLYEEWAAYRDFVHRVTIDARIEPTKLAYSTIAAFTRRPTQVPTVIDFEGEVRGPVSELKGRLWNVRTGSTELDAAFEITGLPQVEDTWFRMRLERLVTTAADVQVLYADFAGGKSLGTGVEDLLERAGRIGFTGSFDGLLKDFTATGRLTMDQGAVDARLQFMPARRQGDVRFVGRVGMTDFGLGRLLGVRDMGAVSLAAGVDAEVRGGELGLTTDAQIGRLDFRGYDYNRVRMNGRFEGRTFTGSITSDDPNLNFVTQGRFDLSGRVPAYDFELDLRSADLHALHLNRRDSVSRLAMRCRAHATGTTLDDVNGTATIDSLSYVSHIDTVRTGVIGFEARNVPGSKRVAMHSDFADIELRGKNSYSNIFRFLGRSIKRYLPSMPAAIPNVATDIAPDVFAVAGAARGRGGIPAVQREVPFDDGYYLLKVNVKEANNVAAIFVPGLEVARGSSLAFLFNPFLDQFSLSVKSDYILRRNLYVGNLMVECRNQADSVSIYASAEQFGVGAVDLPNLSVIGGVKENRIALATRFSNPENGSNALLSTSTTIGRSSAGLPQVDVTLYPTTFTIDDQVWYITPSHVLVDTLGVEFRDFRLWGAGQELAINGRATASEADTLRVRVRDFDISPLSQFVSRQGYRVAGRLGGEAKLVAPLGQLQFAADMKLDSLAVNGYQLGSVDFDSEWDRPRRWVRFGLRTPDGERPVSGVYDSGRKRYRVDCTFPRFDMVLLEPLLTGILEDTRGTADTKLVVTGGPEGGPVLNGTIDLKSYGATVAYTRARYTLAGPVTVKNNRFELPPVAIWDGLGGTGTISAWFDSEYFRKLRFGVRVDFRDLLCLNTSLQDNPVFYGRTYASGAFSVSGDDTRTLLSVRAETAKSSTFVMPLSEVSTIAEADFITFAERDRPKPESRVAAFRRQLHRPRQRTKSELNVDLNLSVLPNTEAQIVMDPRLGDAIKGRGNGRFRMNIVPARDVFTMDGQYDITEGTYLFTLYGVLANKYFVIQPGSVLSWTGDPADPLVDINAVYRVRTSLKPLMGANSVGSGTGNGNVNVNCGINLTDHLFNPSVRLSITAPGADPETQNLLRNLLNTEESTTMQFAYLMLSNSFMPDNQANAIGTMSGSLAGIAGMEFLSNQISNLISGSNYNIRFGYRPQSDLTSEEVTFDVGADIIANKLSVEVGGNYDVGGTRGAYSNTNNPLSVDGYVTWVLNKSGSLKVKGFTRTIDRFDESQGLQDNGVGVYYRQEFQSLGDLQRRYRAWRSAVQLRRAEQQGKRSEKRQERRADSTVVPVGVVPVSGAGERSAPSADSTLSMPLGVVPDRSAGRKGLGVSFGREAVVRP